MMLYSCRLAGFPHIRPHFPIRDSVSIATGLSLVDRPGMAFHGFHMKCGSMGIRRASSRIVWKLWTEELVDPHDFSLWIHIGQAAIEALLREFSTGQPPLS